MLQAGDADRVELLYTRFTSLISSEPSLRTMLPLSPTGIETEGDEIFTMTSKVRSNTRRSPFPFLHNYFGLSFPSFLPFSGPSLSPFQRCSCRLVITILTCFCVSVTAALTS